MSRYTDLVRLADPLSLWPMNDTFGSITIKDIVGEVDATPTGDLSFLNDFQVPTGDREFALGFTAGDTSLETSPELNTSQFSIEAWLIPQLDSTTQHIMANDQTAGKGGSSKLGYRLLIDGSDNFVIETGDGAGGSYAGVTDGTDFALDTLVHVVATHDGTSVRLYTNGVLRGTTAHGHTASIAASPMIGATSAGVSDLTAVLGLVTYYDRALTDEEVEQHYAVGASGPDSGLGGAGGEFGLHLMLEEATSTLTGAYGLQTVMALNGSFGLQTVYPRGSFRGIMNTTDRDALADPPAQVGDVIINTDNNYYEVWNGIEWVQGQVALQEESYRENPLITTSRLDPSRVELDQTARDIELQSSTFATGNGVSAIQVARPANTKPYDIIVAILGDEASGWDPPDDGDWDGSHSFGSISTNMSIYTHIVTTHEPEVYAFTPVGGAADVVLTLLHFTGVEPYDPVGVPTTTTESGDSTAHTIPSVEADEHGYLIGAIVTDDPATFVFAAGLTELADNSAAGIALAVAGELIAETGPTGDIAVTSSVSTKGGTIGLPLNPFRPLLRAYDGNPGDIIFAVDRFGHVISQGEPPNALAARLYLSGTQTVNSGNNAVIGWTAEDYDHIACHTSGGNGSRLYAQRDGTYRVSAQVNVDADNSHHNGPFCVTIRKNAAGSSSGGTLLKIRNYEGHASLQSGDCEWTGDLVDGDYVEIFFRSPNEGRVLESGSDLTAVEFQYQHPDVIVGGSGADGADLAPHDHTTADGSGVLTNDEHDGFSEFAEIADPTAPGANKSRLYTRDNGSGKTQLCVVFPTGAVQVIATEP